MATTVITELTNTCTACPSQWEGKTADGQHVYIRFRGGHGRIGIGTTLDDAIRSDGIFEWFSGGMFDGYCTLLEVDDEIKRQGSTVVSIDPSLIDVADNDEV